MTAAAPASTSSRGSRPPPTVPTSASVSAPAYTHMLAALTHAHNAHGALTHGMRMPAHGHMLAQGSHLHTLTRAHTRVMHTRCSHAYKCTRVHNTPRTHTVPIHVLLAHSGNRHLLPPEPGHIWGHPWFVGCSPAVPARLSALPCSLQLPRPRARLLLRPRGGPARRQPEQRQRLPGRGRVRRLPGGRVLPGPGGGARGRGQGGAGRGEERGLSGPAPRSTTPPASTASAACPASTATRTSPWTRRAPAAVSAGRPGCRGVCGSRMPGSFTPRWGPGPGPPLAAQIGWATGDRPALGPR